MIWVRMNVTLIAFSAAFAYLLGGLSTWHAAVRCLRPTGARRAAWGSGSVSPGCCCTRYLYIGLFTAAGLNLSFFNALSLAAWSGGRSATGVVA